MLESRLNLLRRELTVVGTGTQKSDSSVDAIAAVVIMSVVIGAVVIWLSGMPS